MKTNFFSSLNTLSPQADWNIVIKKVPGLEIFAVSIQMKCSNINDKAINLIPPLNIKGTLPELDDQFFEMIKSPIQKTDSLFSDLTNYEKSVEEARKQSKMQEDTKNKENKDKAARQTKFADAIKRIADLQIDKKYGEAIGMLEHFNVKDYPEQEKKITEKMAELKKLVNERTLFEI